MNIVFILASFHSDEGLSGAGKERVRHAAQLLHDNPTSMALITGGELAYGGTGPHHEYIANQLSIEGIPPTRILATLADTRHTADEALRAAEALEEIEYETKHIKEK